MSFDPPLEPAAYGWSHQVRVRFAETDAMTVVHHAAYLVYLEEARVAYLRDAGHPYVTVQAEGVDFAVLEAFVRYLRPLRFDDVVDIGVIVAGASRTTFEIGYLLSVDGVVHATAVTVHGCVDARGRATRTPPWLLDVMRPVEPPS